MICWGIRPVFKEGCLKSFCIGVIVQFFSVCDISVFICIRDFTSVLVIQGDWKSLWVQLSLILLLLNVSILGVFDECSSVGCSSDSLLRDRSSDEEISGFQKEESNPWEILWFEITFCFNNSFRTDYMKSLSMTVSSIVMICSWIAIMSGHFPFLYLISPMPNKVLGWNALIIDSKRLSYSLSDVIDKFW